MNEGKKDTVGTQGKEGSGYEDEDNVDVGRRISQPIMINLQLCELVLKNKNKLRKHVSVVHTEHSLCSFTCTNCGKVIKK